MPAIFPGSVRVFTTKVDLVDTVMASHVNLLQDEVTSVQTTLGTSLLSSTWAGVYSNTTSHINLSTRLINIEAGVKAANTTLAAISGPVVGTTDSQTLTNKILTNPTINAATITGAFASSATITGGTVNPTTLQQGGIAAVTVSGTQTLTGKTLNNAIHTGIPTAPTAASVTDSDQIATTAYVKTLLGTSDTNISAHTAATTAHGATGAVVGTTNAQTLTSKTLTNPTINAAVITGAVTSTATITGGTINPATLQQGGVAAVVVSGAQTLTGKTLTSPIISSIVNTGTLTLPTSTDTLVGRATTDTLTGKTISGANNTLSNIAQASVTSLTTDLAAKADLSLTSTAKTANYTIDLGDAGESIEMNVASANALNVPNNNTVAFPLGTTVLVIQSGAGQTTVTPVAGVTINATPGLKLRTQWSVATLIKRGTNEWVLAGDVVA